MIDGKQRLRNIRTKVRIMSQRNLRAFLADEIDVLPCMGDYERELIIREFDRLQSPDTE